MKDLNLTCPHCHGENTLDFRHIDVPSLVVPVLREIVCDECGATWNTRGVYQGVTAA